MLGKLSCGCRLVLGISASLLMVSTPGMAIVPDSTGSQKFAGLAETFMKDSLALSPSNASQAGYHQHTDQRTGQVLELDAMLDDLSESGIALQRSFYNSWRDKFHKETPLSALGPQDAADWQLIDDQIGLKLLETALLRPRPETEPCPSMAKPEQLLTMPTP